MVTRSHTLGKVIPESPPPSGNRKTGGGGESDADVAEQYGLRIESQKFYLRYAVFGLGIIAIGAAVYLEYYILCLISYYMPNYNSLLLALALSPIISITVIVVSMMIGVFRGYNDQSIQPLPPASLLHRIILSTQ